MLFADRKIVRLFRSYARDEIQHALRADMNILLIERSMRFVMMRERFGDVEVRLLRLSCGEKCFRSLIGDFTLDRRICDSMNK